MGKDLVNAQHIQVLVFGFPIKTGSPKLLGALLCCLGEKANHASTDTVLWLIW
jgi:hypothetical protein